MSRAQKRSRHANDSGPKSGKKRKVQKQNGDSLFTTHEDLQWREVAVSERLEDAEGFSTLEEIDHIEVSKDKDDAHVQFRVCTANYVIT